MALQQGCDALDWLSPRSLALRAGVMHMLFRLVFDHDHHSVTPIWAEQLSLFPMR